MIIVFYLLLFLTYWYLIPLLAGPGVLDLRTVRGWSSCLDRMVARGEREGKVSEEGVNEGSLGSTSSQYL